MVRRNADCILTYQLLDLAEGARPRQAPEVALPTRSCGRFGCCRVLFNRVHCCSVFA